mmetsp:Transcript_53729/g.136414  ORF Transcript_53729/g.136414 Transcript_53729/m.136414 type:complete len:1005 (-) Transcript_53729:237-3251(-)
MPRLGRQLSATMQPSCALLEEVQPSYPSMLQRAVSTPMWSAPHRLVVHPSPRTGYTVVNDCLASRQYVSVLVHRAALRAQERQDADKQSQAVVPLQRAARRFVAVIRWRRKVRSVVCIQRCTRGLLQRLRMASVGHALLASKRSKHEDEQRLKMDVFVQEQKKKSNHRVAVAALSSLAPGEDRSEAWDELLKVAFDRAQLPGLKVTKEFLSSFHDDMLCRIAFGEEIRFPPMLLSGPPGSGKRLSAKLVHKELCALHLCKGPFTEVQTYAELKDAFSDEGDGIVSKCVYVSDLYDRPDPHWDVIIKKTLKALPKAALIFGLNNLEAMNSIQGCFLRSEAVRLVLPSITHRELAEITEHSLRKRGYMFAGGLSAEMLLRVISEQWTSTDIANRNAHLAGIMVDRAILNKSKRKPLRFGECVNPAVLLPEDFGVVEACEAELELEKAKVMQEMESLPGFEQAKAFLGGLCRRVEFVKSGGNPSVLASCMNLVLTGNPGVGKTTFARLMFRILRSHGVLKRDAFVEMNALQLKGKYRGHTAPQVIEAFRSAHGGALFLDEAYALCSEGHKDSFSSEAVHTLLTEVENHRSDVLVILAGYKDKMGHLLAQDPGLSRRFPLRLDLPDYTSTELALIAEKVARERFGYSLEVGLVKKLERHIEEEHRQDIRTHNAALAVGLVERAIERMTCRMMEKVALSRGDDDATLVAEDFGIQDTTLAEIKAKEEQQSVQRELGSLVGMDAPKEHLRMLSKKIEFVRMGGSPKLLDTCMNVILTGNPGTGKTTFARILFRFLRAHGVLKKDVFVERNALELKGEYCGQTAPKIREIFEMAVGGCVFLDEAYGLANGDKFSNEAIRMLLTEVENHRTEVLVVLAGYEDKMADFLRADPGLARRFPYVLRLPDYSPRDIAVIARRYASDQMGVDFEDGVEDALARWLGPNMELLEASKHNGGLAVNLVEQALGRMADRVIESVDAARPVQDQRLSFTDFALESELTIGDRGAPSSQGGR